MTKIYEKKKESDIMWIRNQSKKVLTNGTISYIVSENKIFLRNENNSNDNSGYFRLAEYSTEEKALKVLDKMERFATDLERCIIEHDMFNDHTTRKVVDNVVFQMPQDSEM